MTWEIGVSMAAIFISGLSLGWSIREHLYRRYGH